jgi:RNA polymerase sigma-70 factor (ECF subfamily)
MTNNTATELDGVGFSSVMTLDTVASVNDDLARDLDRAFPALVRDLQDGIFSGVRRMVPSTADAEDITQETFIRAYRALSGYETDRIRALNLRGWIWTIALNLCRNAARARSRRPRTVELDRDAFSPQPGPEAAALRADASRLWSERLGRLPAAQRTAVVLRHVVGLSYAEIAAATGRAEGTAKTDVYRGLAKLQETLL